MVLSMYRLFNYISLEILEYVTVHVAAWVEERCPPPAMPEAIERANPEVIRSGELVLPFICCSTWESDPHLDNTGELALVV